MNNIYNAFAGTDPADVGPEQFIEPEARHEFSAKYRDRRRALIWEVASESGGRKARTAPKATTRITWRAAAAVAAVCIAAPTAAWAITGHADFLAGAFGDGWRISQPSEQALQDQGGEKASVPVVYPASEVAQLDLETAKALLGDAVCDDPVTLSSPDGHELTITSSVRSENALVYRFTLHRDGGATALAWNERTNNVAAKGAQTPLDAQFSWAAGGDEFVYVDPNASAADTIVGYAYSVFGDSVPAGKPITLTVYTCDVPFDRGFTEDQFHVQSYEIPCTKAVASTTFASAEGSTVAISPLGLVLDERALFARPAGSDGYDMAQDPVNVRRIAVKMDDGDAYTVFDRAADLDNSLSACGFDASLSVAFNRLVDPALIASVEVDVTGVQDMDDMRDADGNWPTSENWPVRTVTYIPS